MAIAIDVEIDPLPAQGSVKTIAGELTKLEDQGKATGDALSKALADLDAEGKAEEKIARLNRELENEERILTTIRGPHKQYAEQLAALDRLLDRDAISTHEYADQVTRLNRQLQASLPLFTEWDRKAHQAANAARAASTVSLPGAPKQGGGALKGAFTGGPGVGSMLAGELAAIAGPAALVGVGLGVITDELQKWAQREKVTKEAANSMLRYTTNIKDATKAVGEMRELSKQLNISLKDSVAAYSSVRDATENLFLSKKKMIDITRNLGMIMQLEDRGVGDSAALMGQLQFAIDRGSISSGELTKMMKAFPPIAAIWRKEFGMTTNELLMAADNGDLAKAGLDRMLTSLSDGTETVKKFSQRYLDFEKVMENNDDNFLLATIAMRKHKEEVEAAVKAHKVDPIDAFETSVRKQIATLEAADLKIRRIVQAYNELHSATALAKQGVTSLSKGVDTAFDFAFGAIMTGKVGSKSSDPWSSDASFQKRLDQAREAMERYKSVLDQIKGPARNFEQTIDILTNMLKSKTITIDEHAAAVRRAIDAYGGGEFLKILEGANSSYAPKKPWERDAQAMAEWAADTEAVINIEQGLQTESEKTALKIEQLNELFRKGRLDAETYERAMQAIADAYQHAELKAEGFMKLVEKGEEERKKAQTDYEKRIQNMSQFVDKTLGEAFRAATDEFTNFCKTGEFSWESLVQTILEGLARIAAAELQAAIVRAIVGAIAGPSPSGVILSGGSGTMDMETGNVTYSAPYQPGMPSGGGSMGGGSAVPMMGGGQGTNVTVINMLGDPRDQTLRTMDSRDGKTVTRNQVAESERLRRQR